MSTTRGIFESFPNQPVTRLDSPFAAASDQSSESAPVSSPFTAVASPFTASAKQESPFSVVNEPADSRQAETAKSVLLPERRKIDGPFQLVEPTEGFGFEAPSKVSGNSPFETVPKASVQVASPFAMPSQPSSSPFSVEPSVNLPASSQTTPAAFTQWQEPAAAYQAPVSSTAPTETSQEEKTPAAFQSQPNYSQQTVPQVAPKAPVFEHTPTMSNAAQAEEFQSDSFSIRQLELRAIFGVDREMNVDEIFRRSRALPGIKQLTRVGSQDIATIEAMKVLLPSLGFGGSLKLFAGSVPLEFIRESGVMLAVQTDGGFAPGVRETLMLVARELSRHS